MYKFFCRYLFSIIVFILSYSLCVNLLYAATKQNSGVVQATKVSTPSPQEVEKSKDDSPITKKDQKKDSTSSELSSTEKNKGGVGVSGSDVDFLDGIGGEDAIIILILIGIFIYSGIIVAGIITGLDYLTADESYPTWFEIGVSGKYFSRETTVTRMNPDRYGNYKSENYIESGRFYEFSASLGVRNENTGLGVKLIYGEMALNFLSGSGDDREYIELPSSKYALFGPVMRVFIPNSGSNIYVNLLAGTSDNKKVGLMAQTDFGFQYQPRKNYSLFYKLFITGSYIEMKSDGSIANSSSNAEILYGAGIGYAF